MLSKLDGIGLELLNSVEYHTKEEITFFITSLLQLCIAQHLNQRMCCWLMPEQVAQQLKQIRMSAAILQQASPVPLPGFFAAWILGKNIFKHLCRKRQAALFWPRQLAAHLFSGGYGREVYTLWIRVVGHVVAAN